MRVRGRELPALPFSAILFVAWASVALWYRAPMLGFLAVAALFSAVGFSVIVLPLCYVMGFRDGALGRATSAAFLLLATFVGMRCCGVSVPLLAVFERGATFLGSFVGYLGLLIASTRWYPRRGSYVVFQIVTILAGLAALFVGSTFGIGDLQKIGGTFFVLYLLGKPFEIPARSVRGYAAIGLLASALVFGFCAFFTRNPELFRRYVVLFG